MSLPASGSQRLSAHVTGRVQGVGFRYFTRSEARKLGLTGWVRNEPDGSVYLIAEGSRAALDTLVERLQIGPSMSRVQQLQLHWAKAGGTFSSFEVRHF
ncbi:MAG: acylphosphatase [Rhodothermales bacterium]